MRSNFLNSWTIRLVIINFLFFLLASVVYFVYPGIIGLIALQPSKFLSMPWTIITSMFMHAPTFPVHILANMFSLLFLGSFLERLIGKKRYLFIYFLGGILGSALYILNFYISGVDTPAIGASGAIFALGGMLAVITPRMPVYIMFIPVAMPMWFGVILSLALLWILSLAAGLPIGNWAHLGGLVAGVLYALYLRRKYKRRFDMISNHFR